MTVMMIAAGRADGDAPQLRLSVAINPVKIVYGLVNIEVEYQLTSHASLVAWGEYLASSWLISRDKHPKAVFRAGPRIYTAIRSDGWGNEASLMGFAGYSWSRAKDRLHHGDLGAEAGFKWRYDSLNFAFPKAILTWPLGRSKVLPGFELLVGRYL